MLESGMEGMNAERIPDAAVIVEYQVTALAGYKQTGLWRAVPETPLWHAIERNHRSNIALWDEEDQARRLDVPDTVIAASKRRIDGCNQSRNDAIEKIDESILCLLPDPSPLARLNSETAGAMVDRLSILALKIHHMGWQTQRPDTDSAHHELCRTRLARLSEQHADLAACLDELFLGFRNGTLRFKIYRQFKMYNDPKFNPWLAKTSEGHTKN